MRQTNLQQAFQMAADFDKDFFSEYPEDIQLFRFQSGAGQSFSVLLGLIGEDKPPFHHLISFLHFSTGIFSPSAIDLRIPGMEVKYNVS